MSEVTNPVLTVTYGEFKIEDFFKLPASSQLALVSSGLAHKLGNEVASEVTAWVKRQVREAAGDPKLEVSREQVQAYRAAHAAAVEEFKVSSTKTAFAEILSGETSARASGPRGPRLNEFELELRQVAGEFIGELLVQKGILAKNAAGLFVLPGTNKTPTNKDVLVTLPDGAQANFSTIVERRLANPVHYKTTEAEAKKRIAARQRVLTNISATTELSELI
jgi:hypothetical protein